MSNIISDKIRKKLGGKEELAKATQSLFKLEINQKRLLGYGTFGILIVWGWLYWKVIFKFISIAECLELEYTWWVFASFIIATNAGFVTLFSILIKGVFFPYKNENDDKNNNVLSKILNIVKKLPPNKE